MLTKLFVRTLPRGNVNLTLTKKLQLSSKKYLEFQTIQRQIETLTENEPEQLKLERILRTGSLI